MKMNRPQTRTILAASAVAALTVAVGPSSAASSRIPELGDAEPPAKALAPAPRARASLLLMSTEARTCDSEAYAIEVNGRRIAILC